eukprot:GHUV01035741.1.p2 GENE.GHUV01035741.1~~GHUV01035741.1.p2  ORF type:complete len:108 (+),score=20.43 GHUV01035741.1:628-951(+)
MWCPNKHANITEWVDDAGATHRKIVLLPMKNMTAKMAVWFMTPAFPETMVVNGKVSAASLSSQHVRYPCTPCHGLWCSAADDCVCPNVSGWPLQRSPRTVLCDNSRH